METEKVKWRCRGDFILYRIINLGRLRGVEMPDSAAQGKKRVVVAVGPKVEDLAVGDVILVTGKPGVETVELVDEPGVWLTRESNAVLVEVQGDKCQTTT